MRRIPGILALVPWADTLNHSSDAWDRSILQYDHEEDVAVLFAHRDYTAGEEVYDSYGTWLTPSTAAPQIAEREQSQESFSEMIDVKTGARQRQ